jgi:hypothetical protein
MLLAASQADHPGSVPSIRKQQRKQQQMTRWPKYLGRDG